METTKQKCLRFLVERGLSTKEAVTVFDRAQPLLQVGDYKIEWDGPAGEYPDPFYSVAFIALREAALEWIDENCPKAWFRPMFTSDSE